MPGPRSIDLTGLTFSRLTVKSILPSKHGDAYWLCLCECGNTKAVSASNLRSGGTKSCGCLKAEMASVYPTTHGYASHAKARHPLYSTWRAMLNRCYREANDNFKHYGARGITVCERWRLSFPDFLADVGERPPGLTIDRVDNNKGYGPDNFKWSTPKEQAANRRSSPSASQLPSVSATCVTKTPGGL